MNISMAAANSSVPPKIIRNCESISLIGSAARAVNGYRIYAGKDVQTLSFLYRAQRIGRTLQHLAERCHGDDRPDCPILEGHPRPRVGGAPDNWYYRTQTHTITRMAVASPPANWRASLGCPAITSPRSCSAWPKRGS